MAQTKRKGRARQVVERVQTGIRLDKKILKVLTALAEYHDISVGDLVEGIVLHAFDGRPAFGGDSLRCIAKIKRIYGLKIDSSDIHRLVDKDELIVRTGGRRAVRTREAAPPAPHGRPGR